MEFGIWPAKYALGERYRAMCYAVDGYSEDAIRQKLRVYADSGYESDMRTYQERGERAAKVWGASEASNNNTLFGTPIDRSKENTERMHSITLSMGADTGKHDHTPNAYNAAIVPIFFLKTRGGLYVTAAGARTANKEEALSFYSHEEIKQRYPSYQAVGWIIEEV